MIVDGNGGDGIWGCGGDERVLVGSGRSGGMVGDMVLVRLLE